MASLIKDEQDGVVIARFQGGRVIDEAQIESLGKQLNELLTEENKKVILNFEGLNFMSSAMIGKLIQFGKKCNNSGVALRLCEINENIEEVVDLMKLGSMFKIDKDEEVSRKKLTSKGWFG